MAKKEMTRYAFISHMEDYIKKLLAVPSKADTNDFLKSFGITGPIALEMLLKKTDPNDENSAIVIRTEKIKDNGTDENGKRLPDTFSIKYRVPRKDYTKKMRNLYISKFENYIVEGCPINEDLNYSSMPLQSTPNPFKSCSNMISQCKPGSTGDRFVNYVIDNKKEYKPQVFKNQDNMIDDILSMDTDNAYKTRGGLKKVNEDGECAGATSCDASSGQYLQPLFGKPIRRKIYVTEEQMEYIKKKINEDCPCVMDTPAGNFGYDAPIGTKKGDPTLDHKNMIEKSKEGK